MALIPQIDNEMNITTQTVEIPSLTYKLDISSVSNSNYTQDYNNMVRFVFDDGHLVAIFNHPNSEVDFDIVDGHLIASSNNQTILDKYHVEFYNIYFDTEYYSDRIMGYVDNIDAVKQAIYHILMVERYSSLIYSDNYGVELNQYIGKGFDYLETTIEETLREALTYDLRIKNVVIDSIELVNKDTAHIKFTAFSIYGNLQMEVNIGV